MTRGSPSLGPGPAGVGRSGRLAGRSTAALLDRFGGTIDPRTASEVAWACALGPGATADPGVPVRLAEVACRSDWNGTEKADALNTLGAALYRAGRYDEAIRRLEEAIRARGGASVPRDWAFLAMAHHRLGHRDEARRWLDRLREHRPSTDPAQFWDELEIRLLRSEAEAVVLYDPVVPGRPVRAVSRAGPAWQSERGMASGAAPLPHTREALPGSTWDDGVGHCDPIGAWRSGGPVNTLNAVSNQPRAVHDRPGQSPRHSHVGRIDRSIGEPACALGVVGPTQAGIV